MKEAYNGLVVINACDFPHRGVWVNKVPPKWLFLLGKPRGGKFLPWIGFKNGAGSSRTVVFCVFVKRRV